MSKPKSLVIIDQLNIALIAVSLILAISIPFKLFLIAYALLGPLHYLTEINWLKGKNYFIKPKKEWMIVFIIITLLISVSPTLGLFDFDLKGAIPDFFNFISQEVSAVLLATFFFAVGIAALKKVSHIIISLICSIALAIILNYYLPIPVIVFGIFIPTVLHVYVFTLLFILFGALKSNSKYGVYNGIALALVPFIVYLYPLETEMYQPSQYVISSFEDSNMTGVSSTISWILGGFTNEQFLPLSESGIKIQIFIAFAYTYHYLNWFSKTSVIGWKQSITRKKSVWIVLIWVAAVSLYLYDYKTGFIALFFLSMLHVLMEFPLNIMTIRSLFSFKKKQS